MMGEGLLWLSWVFPSLSDAQPINNSGSKCHCECATGNQSTFDIGGETGDRDWSGKVWM